MFILRRLIWAASVRLIITYSITNCERGNYVQSKKEKDKQVITDNYYGAGDTCRRWWLLYNRYRRS